MFWAYFGSAVGVVLLLVVIFDVTQRTHTILHNFPVIGHFRYLLERIGPELRQYIVARPWAVATTSMFNLTGSPVTQVPLGLNRGGLPLGVQVVAGRDRDHVSIAIAMAL